MWVTTARWKRQHSESTVSVRADTDETLRPVFEAACCVSLTASANNNNK